MRRMFAIVAILFTVLGITVGTASASTAPAAHAPHALSNRTPPPPPASVLQHITSVMLARERVLFKARQEHEAPPACPAMGYGSCGGWAGYSVTMASGIKAALSAGTFTVPTDNCAHAIYAQGSSYDFWTPWFGIDGFPGNTVEQGGVYTHGIGKVDISVCMS